MSADVMMPLSQRTADETGNTSTNCTTLPVSDRPESKEEVTDVRFIAVDVTIVLLIAVLGLLGNGIVVAWATHFRRLSMPVNAYIINLAIADCLFGALLPVVVPNLLTRRNVIGEVSCVVSGAVLFSCTLNSLYTQTAIAIGRCRHVVCVSMLTSKSSSSSASLSSQLSRVLHPKCIAGLVITFLWAINLLALSLVFIVFDGVDDNRWRFFNFNRKTYTCILFRDDGYRGVVFLIVSFVLPLVFTTTSYVIIYCIIERRRRKRRLLAAVSSSTTVPTRAARINTDDVIFVKMRRCFDRCRCDRKTPSDDEDCVTIGRLVENIPQSEPEVVQAQTGRSETPSDDEDCVTIGRLVENIPRSEPEVVQAQTGRSETPSDSVATPMTEQVPVDVERQRTTRSGFEFAIFIKDESAEPITVSMTTTTNRKATTELRETGNATTVLRETGKACVSKTSGRLTNASRAQDRMFTRMMMSIFVGYVLCFGPISVVTSVDPTTDRLAAWVHKVAAWLAYLHCCANPVLYGITNPQFWCDFVSLMRRCKCNKSL